MLAQLPQTWGSPSRLRQNPPHSKLSRFFIYVAILIQLFSCAVAGGQLVHGGYLPWPLSSPWRPHGYQVNLVCQHSGTCFSLQGLCQHLLRVAVSPPAQSQTVCAQVDLSRIDLWLNYWPSNYLQACSRAAKLVRKKDYHSFQPPFRPEERRRWATQTLILLCKSQFELVSVFGLMI